MLASLLAISVLHGSAVIDSTTLHDSVRVFKQMREVVVVAHCTTSCQCSNHKKMFTSTDEVLKSANGVDMIRRANFATEPVIRGLSLGQISLTIDGMKMHSACVDRMDPISAYIEVENLRELEVSKGIVNSGGTQAIGGGVNFITQKAELTEHATGGLEVGYDAVSTLTRLRGEFNTSISEYLAVRASMSAKRSNGFYSGNSVFIENSGYEKENYLLSLLWKMPNKGDLKALFISDNARDIGYPGLIMDTRKTESYIASIEYDALGVSTLLTKVSTKVYGNSVYHSMDDYDRGINEIQTRAIMPNMYMPMVGTSQTYGAMAELSHVTGTWSCTVKPEVSLLFANAVMNMLPLDKKPTMSLYNVPNVLQSTVGGNVQLQYCIREDLIFGVNTRYDYVQRVVRDLPTLSILQTYWNSPTSNVEQNVFSSTLIGEYLLDDATTFKFSIGRLMRAPTHIENFGYYLYNPNDNSVYIGSANLRNETSINSELSVTTSFATVTFSASVFNYSISDFIAGRTVEKGDTSNHQFTQAFKIYSNVGNANLVGFESHIVWGISENFQMRGSIRHQKGSLKDMGDAMPFIPPTDATVAFEYNQDSWWMVSSFRMVGNQERVSNIIAREDITSGFYTADIRLGFSIGYSCIAKCGITNLFDTLYHEHIAVNNLASTGRNFYASITYSF